MRERPTTIARIAIVVAASVSAGCAARGQEAQVATPSVTNVEMPEPPRRPDGVVLEPSPAMPEVAERAPSSGVVSLREPLGGEAVVSTVRAMFRGFAHEDREALAALLTADAVSLGGARAGHGALLDLWSARLRSLDYEILGDTEVARVEAIERFTYPALGTSGAPARPTEMKPGDLLVRVPVSTPRAGAEPLFGDVVILLLRREGEGFKIAGEGEE